MRKGILFIPLSNNADSMMNIINIVFCDQCCKENNLPLVDKITFLYTSEFDIKINSEDKKMSGNDFCNMVRNKLSKECVETRQRVVISYAKDVPKAIMDGVKEVGKENIIIDLTCGKKDITGSLYTTACISQIRNMIYVEVPRINNSFPKLDRTDYENMRGKFFLTRYEYLDEIEHLASLNQMDFIYYKKNIQEIRHAIPNNNVESICTQLEHAVAEYFFNDSVHYQSAIRILGLISEEMLDKVSFALYERYSDLKIAEYDKKYSLNTIRKFEAAYINKDTPKETKERLDEVFDKIPTLYEMFETLRIYRNQASHKGKNTSFKKEEVKLLLDIMFLLFNNIIEIGLAGEIWSETNEE